MVAASVSLVAAFLWWWHFDATCPTVLAAALPSMLHQNKEQQLTCNIGGSVSIVAV